MKRHILGVDIVLLTIFSIVYCTDASSSDDELVPLPKHVKPIEYELWIHPNLSKGTYYNGTVVITVLVSKNTDSITLHSKNLTIRSATISTEKALVEEDIKNDFLILTKKDANITKGTYNITIKFEGDMGNKTHGFYRGHDVVRKKKVYFGVTFFTPINARTAFPCFDEPQIKARFSIGVVRANDEFVISNTRSIGTTILPNNIGRENFQKTPPLPTYLIMWFVGKFNTAERLMEMDHEMNDTTAILRVRTTGRPSKIKNVKYAADELPKIVKWFRFYTGIEWMCSDFVPDRTTPNFHKQNFKKISKLWGSS